MKNISFTKSLLIMTLALLSVKFYTFFNISTFAQEGEATGNEALTAVEEKVEEVISVEKIKSFTDEEIDILKRLAERRQKLLEWEEELKVKYNVLSITEEKIDKKLEELRVLKKRVESALEEYRKEEDKKTQSLVKIYENMKPKDAAEIMARMKIENILPIVDRMKEKNAAEILAKMDPRVAKEITSRLAEVGRLSN